MCCCCQEEYLGVLRQQEVKLLWYNGMHKASMQEEDTSLGSEA